MRCGGERYRGGLGRTAPGLTADRDQSSATELGVRSVGGGAVYIERQLRRPVDDEQAPRARLLERSHRLLGGEMAAEALLRLGEGRLAEEQVRIARDDGEGGRGRRVARVGECPLAVGDAHLIIIEDRPLFEVHVFECDFVLGAGQEVPRFGIVQPPMGIEGSLERLPLLVMARSGGVRFGSSAAVPRTRADRPQYFQ